MDGNSTSKDIHSAFDLFDRRSCGEITIKDLREVARELGEEASEEELRVRIL
tara:strand:- start:663 stop:818 length:156 start_codon:yes stop_codon:yes gene_type:complete